MTDRAHSHYALLRKHWSQRNDSAEHREMIRHFVTSLRSMRPRRRPVPHVWLCVPHYTERAEREGIEWHASVHALQRRVCEECGWEMDCLPLDLSLGMLGRRARS